jgi:anti-sigma factor RsiW
MSEPLWHDEILMAYADGELPADQAHAVAAAAAVDPAIAQRIAFFRTSSQIVRVAFEPVLEQPIPDHLRATVMALGTQKQGWEAQRVPGPLQAATRKSPWPQLALAAALACAIGISAGWVGAQRWQAPGGAASLAVAVVAMPRALVEVLASVPAGQRVTVMLDGRAAAVLPVASYGAAAQFCRELDVRWSQNSAPDSLRIIGCRTGREWRLDAIARGAVAPYSADSYEPASGSRDLGTSIGIGSRLDADMEAQRLRE